MKIDAAARLDVFGVLVVVDFVGAEYHVDAENLRFAAQAQPGSVACLAVRHHQPFARRRGIRPGLRNRRFRLLLGARGLR